MEGCAGASGSSPRIRGRRCRHVSRRILDRTIHFLACSFSRIMPGFHSLLIPEKAPYFGRGGTQVGLSVSSMNLSSQLITSWPAHFIGNGHPTHSSVPVSYRTKPSRRCGSSLRPRPPAVIAPAVEPPFYTQFPAGANPPFSGSSTPQHPGKEGNIHVGVRRRERAGTATGPQPG